MKYRTYIFVLTAIAIFVLGLIAHLQYFQTKRQIIEFYSQKQMTLARQASLGLEAFVASRSQTLEVLVRLPGVQNLDRASILTEFQQTYKEVRGFEFLVLVDSVGIPLMGYPAGFPCLIDQPAEVQQRFYEAFGLAKNKRETIIFSKNVAVNGQVFVCLISPIFTRQHIFLGAILGIIHIDDALQEALEPIFKGRNDYVWLLNEQGYLLYHPNHEDMLLRNVIKSESSCLACHRQFTFEQQMLATDIGVGLKQNRGAAKVIIGYARVPLKHTYWIVAVSSPFSDLLASIRNQFISFLLLIIFMMITITVGANLINRINNKLTLAKMEQAQEQQKHLAIIGAMAARIAHEIKNPLASIQTGIQLLESQIQNGEQQKGYYERLRSEIQRVDKILKGLLAYAREEQLEARLTDITPLIKRFVAVITPTLEKQSLVLETHIDADLPQLWLDELKMEQVLWNIMLNASQASQPGGRIFLSIVKNRGGVEMRLQDEGTGIPNSIRHKIFQPFFSSRSHGTGLGLAISQKIVELHRGKITIDSKEGAGTTVVIYLPTGEAKS
ncbi:MAG: ATP-binding protein [candidate division KSB1 bacterium]|nr:ATP-binding protein [candidate division KSB1 bacterium]